jgi:hypothetical protein
VASRHYEKNTDLGISQVVQNACATLAIVNALGNIPDLTVGDVLGNIFSFGVGMDPWVSLLLSLRWDAHTGIRRL